MHNKQKYVTKKINPEERFKRKFIAHFLSTRRR